MFTVLIKKYDRHVRKSQEGGTEQIAHIATSQKVITECVKVGCLSWLTHGHQEQKQQKHGSDQGSSLAN